MLYTTAFSLLHPVTEGKVLPVELVGKHTRPLFMLQSHAETCKLWRVMDTIPPLHELCEYAAGHDGRGEMV